MCDFPLFALTMAYRMIAKTLVKNKYTPVEHILVDDVTLLS